MQLYEDIVDAPVFEVSVNRMLKESFKNRCLSHSRICFLLDYGGKPNFEY